MTEIEQRQDGRSSTVGALIFLLFGLIVWALQFTMVYGAHTLMCLAGWATSVGAIVIGVTAVAAITLFLALLGENMLARLLGVVDQTPGRKTYVGIFRLVTLLSIVAVVWSGATVLIVSSC